MTGWEVTCGDGEKSGFVLCRGYCQGRMGGEVRRKMRVGRMEIGRSSTVKDRR